MHIATPSTAVYVSDDPYLLEFKHAQHGSHHRAKEVITDLVV